MQGSAYPSQHNTAFAASGEGSRSKEGKECCRVAGEPRWLYTQAAATAVGHSNHTQATRWSFSPFFVRSFLGLHRATDLRLRICGTLPAWQAEVHCVID